MPRTKNTRYECNLPDLRGCDCTGGPREVSEFLDSCGWRCCGVLWNQALLLGLDAGAANGLNEAVELAAAWTYCLASAY